MQKKPKIISLGQNWPKYAIVTPEMEDPHNFSMAFKFYDPWAYITYLMLLYLPWFEEG